jgi:hypothetical protein
MVRRSHIEAVGNGGASRADRRLPPSAISFVWRGRLGAAVSPPRRLD